MWEYQNWIIELRIIEMNIRIDEKISKDRQEGIFQGMSLNRKRNGILNLSKTDFPNERILDSDHWGLTKVTIEPDLKVISGVL